MRGPTVSPTASRVSCELSRTPAISPPISAAKDSAPARPSRITADHLQQIAGRLTKQDWRVLSFVASSRLASGKQLARGVWMADRDTDPSRARIARRAIKRLADWRVIDPLPGRTVGGLHGGSDTLVYGVGSGRRVPATSPIRLPRRGSWSTCVPPPHEASSTSSRSSKSHSAGAASSPGWALISPASPICSSALPCPAVHMNSTG
jgi:hypothetical protein